MEISKHFFEDRL